MAKLVIINDGPGGKGATYKSDGLVRAGFATWDEAVKWASFWGVSTANLPTIAWADADRLLGPDRGALAGTGAPAGGLIAHTHALSLSGESGPAVEVEG